MVTALPRLQKKGRVIASAFLVLAFAGASAYAQKTDGSPSTDSHGFILLMHEGTIDEDLAPWLTRFGDPGQITIQKLSALSMIIVKLPPAWQVADDVFCTHLNQTHPTHHPNLSLIHI